MWKLVRLAVVLLAVVVCSCGGGGDNGGGGGSSGGGGDDGGGTPSPGESAGTSLTTENAAITSQAISSAATAVTESINSASPSAMSLAEKTLTELKDTGSFTRTATGSGGGTCTLTGSGASELNSDPMTFSISGTMVCSSYVTTVTASTGDNQVTLNGTISASMSGSIRQGYSTVETSFTINWSNLTVNIGSESYSSVSGNYSLSLAGSNGVMTVTENGTVGGKSVSQSYTYTYGYTPAFSSVSIYDTFDDDNFIYADTVNYLGTYTSPSSNTCTVNSTANINAMTSSSIYFDVRGTQESASGGLSSYYDMYFYTGYATTYYCTFGVSSANISSGTIDTFATICYNNSDVRLCSAGWTKVSPYSARYAGIKEVPSSQENAGDALERAFENLDEYSKSR